MKHFIHGRLHTSLALLGVLLVGILLLAACTDKRTRAIKKIERLQALMDSPTISDSITPLLYQEYQHFAAVYPDDTLSAYYLFQGAEMAQSLGQSMESIKLFQRIREQYPQYSKNPEALFMTAFIYENALLDTAQARKYYQLFLETYPEHALAEDAQLSIDFLGKTPEEIISYYKLQNGTRE